MTLSLGGVFALFCFGIYVIYLYQAFRVRELALQHARRACEEANIQLLDQSVSIRKLSLSKDNQGRWRVWRQYRFEYTSDGAARQKGHVIMLGMRPQALVMADQPTIH